MGCDCSRNQAMVFFTCSACRRRGDNKDTLIEPLTRSSPTAERLPFSLRVFPFNFSSVPQRMKRRSRVCDVEGLASAGRRSVSSKTGLFLVEKALGQFWQRPSPAWFVDAFSNSPSHPPFPRRVPSFLSPGSCALVVASEARPHISSNNNNSLCLEHPITTL